MSPRKAGGAKPHKPHKPPANSFAALAALADQEVRAQPTARPQGGGGGGGGKPAGGGGSSSVAQHSANGTAATPAAAGAAAAEGGEGLSKPLVWIDLGARCLKGGGVAACVRGGTRDTPPSSPRRHPTNHNTPLRPPALRLPEMTGLDPEHDHVLQIAVIVTDGAVERVIEGPELTIHHPEDVLQGMNEWCIEHHGKSGLTQASPRRDEAARGARAAAGGREGEGAGARARAPFPPPHTHAHTPRL